MASARGSTGTVSPFNDQIAAYLKPYHPPQTLLHSRFKGCIAGQQLIQFEFIAPVFQHHFFKYLLERQIPVMDIRVVLVLFREIRMGFDAVGDVDELDALLFGRCTHP